MRIASPFYLMVILSALVGLQGCGGGGSSSADVPTVDESPLPPVVEPPPDPEPDPPTARAVAESASRLASRATFGLAYAGIMEIAETGEAQWLESQFALPIGWHEPVVTDLLDQLENGELREVAGDINNFDALFRSMAWWQQAVYAPDPLRQRVAYALSQIFVVSDTVNTLLLFPYAVTDYQDMLLRNAFGNFRDLLLDVTLHPAMGVYLSHVNNAKADPLANTFPDENYAREVMQLFSIGLFELNPDGTEKQGADGQPIPTYDNGDIGEFAKVFTGLSFGGNNSRFGARLPEFRQPMVMFDEFHDTGEKQLLNGTVLPAGQSGVEDIEQAIDNLFNHPNAAPFFGRQIIQRLVTSNPSPAYIQRVSAAFADNGSGVRGDMQAILRAVLLDPEALQDPGDDPGFGKLREPVLRVLATLKHFNVSSPDGFYANTGRFFENQLQQHPLSAPSVFNFYLPSHQPVGLLAEAGLVAPEFQITNSNTIVAMTNIADVLLFQGLYNDLVRAPFQRATIDLSEYEALADDPEALIDRLDLVMTYGTLSDTSRATFLSILTGIADLELRLDTAIYLMFISPDYAVER